MADPTAEHGTFVITRSYPVPPARVFDSWSSREAKARWFGVPDDADYTLDFRVGGSETNRGGAPGGPTYTFEATHQDIVPACRIVYTYTMKADGALVSVSVTTVEFQAAGAGATLTFTEQGVFLDGADTPTVREKGTGDLLDALGAALA